MGKQFTIPAVIDGIGSCSELTDDDPDNLCSEDTVLKKPELLLAAKRLAARSGFKALLSPTGEISHTYLEEAGLDERLPEFISALTKITLSASDNRLPVCGVLSASDPAAAEYGKNVFESAYFDHLERITLLKAAGAAFILLRNFEKLWDMRAGVLAAKSADMPVVVTMKVDDEGKNQSNTDYIAALITIQSIGADAFGIECTDGIEKTSELIKRAFPHAEIPLAASVDLLCLTSENARLLNECGASAFFNTSRRFNEETVCFLAGLQTHFTPGKEMDSRAAAIFREAFFLPEDLELSEPLDCGYDMSDDIIDLDDETVNAIYIQLHSTDDAALLADNAIMSHLPFVIHTDDPTVLEAALRYYQGRLIVDSRCEMDEDVFSRLVKKYGAVLY